LRRTSYHQREPISKIAAIVWRTSSTFPKQTAKAEESEPEKSITPKRWAQSRSVRHRFSDMARVLFSIGHHGWQRPRNHQRPSRGSTGLSVFFLRLSLADHCKRAPICRSLYILMTLCVARAAHRSSLDAAFAPRAAGRQGSCINAQRGGLGMRSFGVPGVPCHARPCGRARAALRGSAWIRGLSGGPAMLWGAGRDLILSASDSRGFFPLGALFLSAF
jgi:hypothetical protein